MFSGPSTGNCVQVFIPTFNRCSQLEAAVMSVLSQTHQNTHVVVLDNASDDGTHELMSGWVKRERRIKYVRNDRNLGMIGNFNQIRCYVSSDYFCVLTDDDVYKPNFVETALGLFSRFPTCGFVGTNAPIRRDGLIIRTMLEGWEEGLHPKGSRVRQCAQSQHPLFTHCLFREGLSQDFIFHESVEMVSDGFLLTCLATKYDMAISMAVTGYWDIHGGNITMNQSKDPMIYIGYLTALPKLYEDYCAENGLNSELKAFYFKKLVVGLLHVGRNKMALEQAFEREDVKQILTGWEMKIIRVLCHVRVLDISLRLKRALRSVLGRSSPVSYD
jgi:glycosyltransferase involved in cell wall biosynthesis